MFLNGSAGRLYAIRSDFGGASMRFVVRRAGLGSLVRAVPLRWGFTWIRPDISGDGQSLVVALMSSIGGSTSANAMAASRQVRPKSIEVRAPQFVFPGLGPGIHERLLVDGRAKPGQDAGRDGSI